MDYIDRLVCPVSKRKLSRMSADLLEADGGKSRYRVIDGIPILMDWDKFQRWNDMLYKPGIRQAEQDPSASSDHYVHRFVKPGWSRLLDLGCGDGKWSAPCAPAVPEVYCVNPGLVALKILRKRGFVNMFPIVALGEQLPFETDFFDGVLNIFVIEHMKDPIPMLAEIRRVLKPSGSLVVSTDNRMYYKYLRYYLEWRERGWGNWTKANPTHVNLMYPSQLRKYVRQAGFEVEQEDYDLTGHSRRERLFGQWISKKYLVPTMCFVCRPLK
jgi:ubiquinone/menaquinone biosynthesis C-methylase UbiE/uncharacterized protein YbaR (Trm112 family)